MSCLPANVLRYGKEEALPEQIPLRAGPLAMFYQAGDLRYIQFDGCEVIRRVYAAVRDRNWGTVLGQLTNVKLDVRADSFCLSYDSEHKEREIHFVWQGEIIGEADGTIRFAFDGEAKTTFLKNRIGFCVLHPIRECVGAPCRVEYVDGTSKMVEFPKLVAAEQPVKDIHDLRAILHEVRPGVWAEVRFEGEVFEMEDQRNWIDASFKTFCTPLRIPFPVEIRAGQRLRQSVTLKLIQTSEAQPELADFRISSKSDHRASKIVNVEIDEKRGHLPQIGLGLPGDALHVKSYGSVELETLRARLSSLRLAHLRVELVRGESSVVAGFSVALSWAVTLGVPLETALVLTDDPEHELRTLARGFDDWMKRFSSLLKWFSVFRKEEQTSSDPALSLARKHLSVLLPDARWGGGTLADFYQLNQFRTPIESCDFVCWSMNPQVHAFDNTSLAETPSAIPAQIESARACFPGKPLAVSPVSLKPRCNPVATGKVAGPEADELPPEVDPRQMSLFGACWTLAAFKHLAESGVDRVTFYETTGWCGVMETATGSPLPERFRSIPGVVFPLYHVLADIGEFAGGDVVVSRSSDPLSVEGLVLREGKRQRVMIANMAATSRTVTVKNVPGDAKLKRLNETNAEFAMREPEKFRAEAGGGVPARNGRIELELMPCEVAKMDFQ